MTERLYYRDATLLTFDAIAMRYGAEPTQIFLDRSAFYPTSGGQPHDVGSVAGIAVVDVIDHADGVLHVTTAPVPLGPVHGIVDATRRHDHMQQHTAQHLLSALAADRLGWDTASVHFGSEHSTIEFDVASATTAQLADLEGWTNAVVAEARPVVVTFEAEDDAIKRGLRKLSDRAGTLRIVTIDGVDRSACGGTHVARTSEIGAVIVTTIERVRGHRRVGFLAGDRVLHHARYGDEALAALASALGVAPAELEQVVPMRQRELTTARKRVAALEAEVGGARAEQLYRDTPPDESGLRQLTAVVGDDSSTIVWAMARRVATLSRTTLVVTDPGAGTIHYATSADSGVDAGACLKTALAAAGGRGGGNPRMAQGSVPDANTLAVVLSAL